MTAFIGVRAGGNRVVGVRITSLPATAEKVFAAIKAKRAQEPKLIAAG